MSPDDPGLSRLMERWDSHYRVLANHAAAEGADIRVADGYLTERRVRRSLIPKVPPLAGGLVRVVDLARR